MEQLSLTMIGLIGVGIFLLTLFLGMNVGIVMLISGFIGILLIRGWDAALFTLGFTVYRTAASQFLVVLPLFILMGMAAAHSGVSDDTFKTLHKWVGHFPGGLAMAAISACTIFGSVCGNVVATSATLGKVALPEMRKYKYSDELSAGTIASGGNLGALVPPSTAFIVYGFVTETPIGALFAAGILPAVLLTLVFMFQIYVQCKLKPSLCELAPAARWKARIISLKGLWGVVVVFGIAMGGIMAGYFTPVEAGAAGATAMFLVGLINRRLNRKGFFRSLLEAGKIASLIMLLIFGAMLFSTFLTASEITQSFSNYLITSDLHPYVVMLIVLFFYWAMGTFMDSWALLIVSLPIFFPIVTQLGFDPLHFGVLCAITVMIGNVSPPVGVTVFALRGVAPDIPVGTIFRGCIPFMMVMTAYMVALIFVPWVSTVLPYWVFPTMK
jgi:tripartite ATP-independent transporter DctM subunit